MTKRGGVETRPTPAATDADAGTATSGTATGASPGTGWGASTSPGTDPGASTSPGTDPGASTSTDPAITALSRPSLRERKRVATMRRIQDAALGLFETRGFQAVTIEEVAEAAEVSPSTVYRYFGTKEGLVIHDEFDDAADRLAPLLLAQYHPVTAVDVAIRTFLTEHFADSVVASRRMRLWFGEPSVGAAGAVMIDEASDRLAAFVADSAHNDLDLDEARAITAGLVAILMKGVQIWYEKGAEGPVAVQLHQALAAARRTFGP